MLTGPTTNGLLIKKAETNDIPKTDFESIRKNSELPFCNNYTLSTKRLDSILY